MTPCTLLPFFTPTLSRNPPVMQGLSISFFGVILPGDDAAHLGLFPAQDPLLVHWQEYGADDNESKLAIRPVRGTLVRLDDGGFRYLLPPSRQSPNNSRLFLDQPRPWTGDHPGDSPADNRGDLHLNKLHLGGGAELQRTGSVHVEALTVREDVTSIRDIVHCGNLGTRVHPLLLLCLVDLVWLLLPQYPYVLAPVFLLHSQKRVGAEREIDLVLNSQLQPRKGWRYWRCYQCVIRLIILI